jgi:hypothetical protein
MDSTDRSPLPPAEPAEIPIDDLYAAAWVASHQQRGYTTSDVNQHYTWWFVDSPEVQRLLAEYRDHEELHRWERAKRVLRDSGDVAFRQALAAEPHEQQLVRAWQQQQRENAVIAAGGGRNLLREERRRLQFEAERARVQRTWQREAEPVDPFLGVPSELRGAAMRNAASRKHNEGE